MERAVRDPLESRLELVELLCGKLGGTIDNKADDHTSEVITQLNKTMLLMANVGISRLHLFYQGPVILAT